MNGNSLICWTPALSRYETLYCWTFNFHKVVRQQNSGAVEDYILPYSAVYLRIQKWKNYWNRSTFAKVIVKIKVARFYGPRCCSALCKFQQAKNSLDWHASKLSCRLMPLFRLPYWVATVRRAMARARPRWHGVRLCITNACGGGRQFA